MSFDVKNILAMGVFYRWIKLLVGFECCFLLYSCQSDKVLIDVKEIDSGLVSSFSTCQSGGGTNDTQVYKKEKLYGSFDVEWLVKGGEWKTVVMSSIGQDLLSIDYTKKQNKILITGVQEFPYDIKVGEAGFIYVGGKMTPLKVSEIPCILNHRYPKSWLKSSVVYKRGNSYFISKKEPSRKIDMELLIKKDPSSKKSNTTKNKKEDNKVYICTTLSWDAFLWFDAELKICSEDNHSTVVDIRDYLVKLTAID